MKRVVLFFGSFNPLHNGHMAMIGHMLTYTPMEEVWLVVSPQSPFKTEEKLVPVKERCNYIERVLAFYNNPKVKLCKEELSLPLPSYTVNTLQALWEQHPQVEFSLLIGSDNLPRLPQWKEVGTILERCTLYVYPRSERLPSLDHLALLPVRSAVHVLNAPLVQLKATAIRHGAQEGHCMDWFVPISLKGTPWSTP